MKQFYLHNGTKQVGPFSKSELKEKNITRKTEIWHEGLSDWTKAENIEELKYFFTTVTPPPIKKKTKSWKEILIKTAAVSIVIIAGLGVYNNAISQDHDTYGDKIMTIEDLENATPTDFLSADGTYDESFWGSKINIDGEITNAATVAHYKDVVVRVTYYSKTKSILGSEDYTLYEVFPPNSVKPFELKIENYKDVNSIGWDVISAVPN